MHIVIIANGTIENYLVARERIIGSDYFIACDGGLRHFPLLGLTPDCIIGDFDSAPPDLLADYRARGVPVVSYPSEKDETDLELAVAHAVALSPGGEEFGGCTPSGRMQRHSSAKSVVATAEPFAPCSIVILGALGGRIDHALANLHVLAQTGSVSAEIWDESTSIRLIKDEVILSRRCLTGGLRYATLSLIPLTTEVTGITTRGLAYPLTDGTLRAGETCGVSNEFTADIAEISIKSGLLLAVLCK
ncbi:MAG: thiamine diphosphokinase [Defluviitaleaceae bacterium]|nr:thiamine diphosphokinase [Defluviitaleaceae bacterium]